MPFPPSYKNPVPGQKPHAPEDSSEEEEGSESPSDIDAPKMVSGKTNPLKMWAQAKTKPAAG